MNAFPNLIPGKEIDLCKEKQCDEGSVRLEQQNYVFWGVGGQFEWNSNVSFINFVV